MLAGAAGGNDAAVLVVERELKFSAVEQEECSVEIRGAVLWLIRRTVTMLPPTTKSDPALDRGAPPLPAVEAAAASGSAIIPSYEALAPAADSLSPREMVFRRTLSCFSADIAEGIPVPLLQAYLALLDDLAGAGRVAAARALTNPFVREASARATTFGEVHICCERGPFEAPLDSAPSAAVPLPTAGAHAACAWLRGPRPPSPMRNFAETPNTLPRYARAARTAASTSRSPVDAWRCLASSAATAAARTAAGTAVDTVRADRT